MQAIILAGGKGTRLRSAVKDLPKPMAPVNDTPFLKYLLNYLAGFDIEKVVLSTGYKHEIIEEHFGHNYASIKLEYSIEEYPLGTGGAIKRALELCSSETVLVINGDTFFPVDLRAMTESHKITAADVTLALKKMTDFDRYGAVLTDQKRVTGFQEKQFCASGLINGGCYLINQKVTKLFPQTEKFSFETEFLETAVSQAHFNAFESDAYFIDIGIPEDYQRAQEEMKLEAVL